jgi:putative sigma-54 modulation protein
MKLILHAKGIAMTRSLESYVERAVLFSLGRFARRIRKIVVRLLDVNGPRGGPDKQCRIQVDLGRLGTSMVAEVDPRIETAVDLAADRAGRTIVRRVDRRLERRRRAGSPDRSPAPAAGLDEEPRE